MQLRRPGRCGPRALALGALLVTGLAAGAAHADGELAMRSVYFKEQATRVVQPMLDARLDIDADTELEVHALVDVITSASVAAGAAGDGGAGSEVAGAAFTERRYETGAALSHRMDEYRCGLSGRFSYEPDYRSIFGGARCQVELAQKNTTLGVALSLGRDHVSNASAQDPMGQATRREGDMTSMLTSASFTQVLSPVLLAGLTYDLIYLDGFLENPYRRVPVGGGAGSWELERVPDSRLRHGLFGNLRGFVPGSRTTLIAGYRFYIDDWGITAHTPEARIVQELAAELDVHARYRFHWQDAASFYEIAYDTGDALREPYITDDVKLSRFTTHTLGVELDTALAHLGVNGALRDARLELVVEYVVQNNRFGNAIVAQTALAVPLAY